MMPSTVKLDEMIYTSDSNSEFSFLLKGEVSGNKSASTKIFNKFISDLRKQPSINRVIVRDQKTLPEQA